MHYLLLSICVLDGLLFFHVAAMYEVSLKMVGICWQTHDFGCVCTNFVWYWVRMIGKWFGILEDFMLHLCKSLPNSLVLVYHFSFTASN